MMVLYVVFYFIWGLRDKRKLEYILNGIFILILSAIVGAAMASSMILQILLYTPFSQRG
jgi:hypothetical protein